MINYVQLIKTKKWSNLMCFFYQFKSFEIMLKNLKQDKLYDRFIGHYLHF